MAQSQSDVPVNWELQKYLQEFLTKDLPPDLQQNLTKTKVPFHQVSDNEKPTEVVDLSLKKNEQVVDFRELTWENGQIAMHGLAPSRAINKPRVSGTFEAIGNQVTQLELPETQLFPSEIVQWIDPQPPTTITTSDVPIDALVPSSTIMPFVPVTNIPNPNPTSATGISTQLESCGGTASLEPRNEVQPEPRNEVQNDIGLDTKLKHVLPSLGPQGCTSMNKSVSLNETFKLGVDSIDFGFTSNSMDTNPTTPNDFDSLSHKRRKKRARSAQNDKSIKRSRQAEIHNQSERRRRDKINVRMKELQKLVPNSNKTDKASMLDEVIDYLKALQAQINIMNRMNFPHMMMPMHMSIQQQQVYMSMMAQMGIGMGLGMGRPGLPQVLNAGGCMPMPQCDHASTSGMVSDPNAGYMGCQQQQQPPMSIDAYGRVTGMYQQQQPQPQPQQLHHQVPTSIS